MKMRVLPVLLLFVCEITAAQSVFDKQGVKALMDKVNAYQRANPWKEFDNNWIRGTYYTGVMACYQATGDKSYLEQCNTLGTQMNWQIPVVDPQAKPSGVNLLTIGQTWLESYMIKKDKAKIAPIIAHLEKPGVKNPVSNPLRWYYESGRRYVDGLYTCPPALAMLYAITKEQKYLQWMETCFWDVYGSLYDNDENLFYRDHRFFPDCIEERKTNANWEGNHQVTASGKKVLWSRGNGWAFAGIARILKYLPKNHASYERYKAVFTNMAESLKDRQTEEGFWYMNLADPDHFRQKETSGTSFFIYGFAYGINNGLLDRDQYLPVVEKAWKSVCNAISDEGKVRWGQRVGDRPVEIQEEDTHEFVSGTFLLAASEVYKLNQ